MGPGGMMPGAMGMQGLSEEQQAQMRMRHQQAMMAGGRPGMMGMGGTYPPMGQMQMGQMAPGQMGGPAGGPVGPGAVAAGMGSPEQRSTGQAQAQGGGAAPAPGVAGGPGTSAV